MILILNNKANLTYKEAKYYEKCLRKYNLIIFPTNCYLPIFKKGKYILGSQDISEFKELNRTGEINAKQLKSLNVKYSLIGHSERRIYNKENNITILNKLERCFENDITPLYCIGDINDTYDELIKQIDVVENRFSDKEIIYVYEPINNIGNLNPNLNNLEDKIKFIKEYIKDNYYKDIKLIYGGGINISNINDIKNINSIDGIIISSESLNLEHVKSIYVKTK
ncbi:MAG: triosephosphate isomerase [Firmicutes bacterium]|nr:triosephosphate isomerase [Bacillota bacterium]